MTPVKHFVLIFITAFISFADPLLARDQTNLEQAKISEAIDNILTLSNASVQLQWLQTQTLTSHKNQSELVTTLSLILPDGETIDVQSFLNLGLGTTALLKRLDRTLRFQEVAMDLMDIYDQLQYFRMLLSSGDSKLSEEVASRIKPVLRRVSDELRETIEWYASNIKELRVASTAERISSAQREIVQERLDSLVRSWGIKVLTWPGETPSVVEPRRRLATREEAEPAYTGLNDWLVAETTVPDEAALEEEEFKNVEQTLEVERQRTFRVNLNKREIQVTGAVENILSDRNVIAKMRYLLLEIQMLDPDAIEKYGFSQEKILSHLEGINEDLTMRGDSKRFALVVTELMNLWLKYAERETRTGQTFEQTGLIEKMLIKISVLSDSMENHQILLSGVKKSVESRNYQGYRKSYKRVNLRAATQLQAVLSSQEIMKNEKLLEAVLVLGQILPARNVTVAQGIKTRISEIQLKSDNQRVLNACQKLKEALERRRGVARNGSETVEETVGAVEAPEDERGDTLVDDSDDTDLEKSEETAPTIQSVAEMNDDGQIVRALLDVNTNESPIQVLQGVTFLITHLHSGKASQADYELTFHAFFQLPYSKVLSPIVTEAIRKFVPEYLQKFYSDEAKSELLADLNSYVKKFSPTESLLEYALVRQTIGIVAMTMGPEAVDVELVFGACENTFFNK